MWDDEGIRVPDPWTPVKVAQQGEDYDLDVWGRRYSVHHSLLPTGIVTGGQERLAGPMRVTAVMNGRPVIWQSSGTRLLRREDGVVVLCGWQAVEDLYLNTTLRLEYDGMMRIDLTMVPVTGRTPQVEQLWLEIPFVPETATLYHYWPQGGGGAVQAANSSNSGALTAPITLPFKPMVWIGDENGGIEWFAESPRYWQTADDHRVLEIVPGAQETVLRIHLVDGEYLPWKGQADGWEGATIPLTVTFGLQATPVKDMRKSEGLPNSCHMWNCCHLESGNPGGGGVFLHEMAAEPGSAETVLDRLEARGVRTVVIHEAWNTVQNYYNVDMAYIDKLKEMIDVFHDRGIAVLPYYGYELSSLNPEWADNFREAITTTAKGGYCGGWIRKPAQRDYIVCHRSKWVKKWEKGLEWMMEEFGFDGVYLDGTIMPWGCANENHGCGYVDAKGQRQITYPLFDVRGVMRDMYTFIHSHGGYINPHQSSCCFTPAMTYCDSYWDGEHIQEHITEDILASLSLDAFRAEYMGANFGVHSEFLVYPKAPFWTWDNALAIALPHGVLPRPTGIEGGMLDSIAPIWQAREDFGILDAQWHPYWENGALVKADQPDIKVSFYALDRGKGMEILLIAANISGDAVSGVTVDLGGWAAAGNTLPTAGRSILPEGAAAISNGVLNFDFERFSAHMVWLHS